MTLFGLEDAIYVRSKTGMPKYESQNVPVCVVLSLNCPFFFDYYIITRHLDFTDPSTDDLSYMVDEYIHLLFYKLPDNRIVFINIGCTYEVEEVDDVDVEELYKSKNADEIVEFFTTTSNPIVVQ